MTVHKEILGPCELYLGDSRVVLKTLTESSVDSVVCDPPYEIDFMGKGWDRSGIAYDVAFWREVLRVLKPGGHLLAASHSRTYHRMTCAIEDAGFDIRDMVDWMYGSGFPKSHNLKGVREGWGTALKPAKEPFALARKPFAGTVAENVARYGTGAMNIDACRIEADSAYASAGWGPRFGQSSGSKATMDDRPWIHERMAAGEPTKNSQASDLGRWPANVIHDGSSEVVSGFPFSTSREGKTAITTSSDGVLWKLGGHERPLRNDEGSAARFFYCAKASIEDREHGLRMFEHTLPDAASFRPNHMDKALSGEEGSPYGRFAPRKNIHPTVKPTDLMRYLCRLITPPGGTVLDPFMGSGSTGRGANYEHFRFVGIEMDPVYFEIAAARIKVVVEEYKQPSMFEGDA